MDHRGAGYWICPRCGGHNLRQLSSCVSCDQPSSPSQRLASGTASPAPQRASSPPRPYLTPSSSHMSPIQPVSPAYGDRSPKAASLAAANNSSYHAAAFMGDLDNKNAIIARLEQHVQSMLEQQGRQRRAHDQEVANIQAQMQQAVESHRGLLVEYRKAASDLAGKHAELALMTTEVSTLREKLTSESKRRHEEAESHLNELDEKQKEIRALKEQVAKLQEAVDTAGDEKLRASRTGRVGVEAPPSNVALQLQATELVVRNEELAATVERLTLDLEAARNTISDVKARYADSLDKVVRDSVQANERAVASITSELHKVREATENAATRDRVHLDQQLRESQELATRLQGQLEREASRYVEKITQLENTIKNLQAHRDQMAEEAKFQAEIQQDYIRERDHLKNELANLKATKDMTRPAPPSAANNSHVGGTAQRQATVTAAEVAQMALAVQSATSAPDASAQQREKNLERELTAAQDKLAAATGELGLVRGQFATQKGIIEQLREQLEETKAQLAEATKRADSMDQALVDHIERQQQQQTAPAVVVDRSAEIEALSKEIFALEDDLEACKAGRAIEVMELRKQLATATADLEARDDELRTVTFELQRVRDAPAQAAKYKEQLSSAIDRADRLEDLMVEKEKLLSEEQKKLVDTTNQFSGEKKALEATVAKLQEELDAMTIALQDAERMCRDALRAQ